MAKDMCLQSVSSVPASCHSLYKRRVFRMRLHPRRALRIVLVVSMVLFVILNFHIIPDTFGDKERFQDYHMMGEGIHAVQDMHVQLGNAQHVGVQSERRGTAEPSSFSRKHRNPKIVIAAGSNQTQVTFKTHACMFNSRCIFHSYSLKKILVCLWIMDVMTWSVHVMVVNYTGRVLITLSCCTHKTTT